MNGSATFDAYFSLGMAITPILLTRWIVSRHLRLLDEPRRIALRDALRPGLTRLSIATIHAVLGLTIWLVLDREAISQGERGWALAMEIGVFHLLWWPFAMPVVGKLYKKAEELRAIATENLGPVRVASLRPRRVEDDIPRSWRLSLLLEFFALFALWGIQWTSWGASLFGANSALDWHKAWPSLLWVGAAIALLLGYSLWIRREVAEPQPVFGTGDSAKDYEAARSEYRRFRVRGIFFLQAFGVAIFFGVALLNLQAARGAMEFPSFGVIGAVLGSLFGCLGAAFGIGASVKAFRLKTLQAEIESES